MQVVARGRDDSACAGEALAKRPRQEAARPPEAIFELSTALHFVAPEGGFRGRDIYEAKVLGVPYDFRAAFEWVLRASSQGRPHGEWHNVLFEGQNCTTVEQYFDVDGSSWDVRCAPCCIIVHDPLTVGWYEAWALTGFEMGSLVRVSAPNEARSVVGSVEDGRLSWEQKPAAGVVRKLQTFIAGPVDFDDEVKSGGDCDDLGDCWE